jgi:hypothetical protein
MAKSGDGDAGGRVYLAGQGLSGPAARPQRLARDHRRATRGPKPGERAGNGQDARARRSYVVSPRHHAIG